MPLVHLFHLVRYRYSGKRLNTSTDVVAVEKDVKAALKRIHRVSPKDERAFGGFNLGEIFNKIVGFSKGMTLLATPIASLGFVWTQY